MARVNFSISAEFTSRLESRIVVREETLVEYYVSELFQNMGPARGRVEGRAAAASITQIL